MNYYGLQSAVAAYVIWIVITKIVDEKNDP